jgi:hypothetical protein
VNPRGDGVTIAAINDHWLKGNACKYNEKYKHCVIEGRRDLTAEVALYNPPLIWKDAVMV